MKSKAEINFHLIIFTTLNKVLSLRQRGQMFMTMHASET